MLRFDDPELYATEIRRLSARAAGRARSEHSQIDFGLLHARAAEVAPRLAREVAAGSYTLEPCVPHAATLGGKARTLYRLDPLDAVVLSVVARVVRSVVDPRLERCIYSYRRGASQWSAASDFISFVREHVRSRPDPRTRGLYVLRRDVSAYGESIDVSVGSPFWTELVALCEGPLSQELAKPESLLRRAFSPLVAHADGTTAPLSRGVPTGLPTQPIACNVYLRPLDRELARIQGGFYGRYGDDLLFAHADPEIVMQAVVELEAGVARLGLRFGAQKSQDLYFTAIGRNPPEDGPFTRASTVSYLGLDLGFDGARLRRDKRRSLLGDLTRRLDRACQQSQHLSTAERADILCGVVRRVMSPPEPLAHRYASWLRPAVLTRSDLAQLDYLIALRVAERLANCRGVRAFRLMTPGELRSRHGLPSLVRAWDEARRAGRHR
jgi:hypothetical protein